MINKFNSAMIENKATDLTLRQEKPEQFQKDFHHRSAIWAAVILFVVLIVITELVGSPYDRLERKKGFIKYVSIKMIEHQDAFVQEEWPDLILSTDFGEWKIIETDDTFYLTEQQVAQQLLGENLEILDWRDLQAYQGETLWNAWSASDRKTPPDEFIEEQMQQHIRKKTLPYLKHDTWLVIDAQGVEYILCRREAWGVCPMSAVTAAGLIQE